MSGLFCLLDTMEGWTEIGYITKIHGYKGNNVVKTTLDVDDYLMKLDVIFLNIENKAIPYFPERMSIQKPNQILVKFEDIETDADAKQLVGKAVIVKSDELPEDDSIIGYEIINHNTNQSVGKIAYLMDIPNNPLAVILVDDDEIYIPIHERLVIKLDDEKKQLYVDIMDGIVEMNQ